MATTNRELEARVRQLEQMLAQAGIAAAQAPLSLDPSDRPDYIEFGSARHAQFLGLVLLDEGEEPPQGQTHILTGRDGQLYCLEDELGAMRFYPGLSLGEVAPVVLRQKINCLEAGIPPVSDRAPTMWTPERMTA